MRFTFSPIIQTIHCLITVVLAVVLLSKQVYRDSRPTNQVELASKLYGLDKETREISAAWWKNDGKNQEIEDALRGTRIVDQAHIDDDYFVFKYNNFLLIFANSIFPNSREIRISDTNGRTVELILNKNSNLELITAQKFIGKEEQIIGFTDNDGDGFTETKFTRGSIMGNKDFKIDRISWQLED
jgi:hypothetical protein